MQHSVLFSQDVVLRQGELRLWHLSCYQEPGALQQEGRPSNFSQGCFRTVNKRLFLSDQHIQINVSTMMFKTKYNPMSPPGLSNWGSPVYGMSDLVQWHQTLTAAENTCRHPERSALSSSQQLPPHSWWKQRGGQECEAWRATRTSRQLLTTWTMMVEPKYSSRYKKEPKQIYTYIFLLN